MTELIKFCCDFCHQPIGYVDLDKIAEPMTPDMFSSLYPANGVPDPFHPSLTYESFKCPYCKLRPFEKADHITLVVDESGKSHRYRVALLSNKEDDAVRIEGAYVCPVCGKGYQHKSSLDRHMKDCNND